MEIMTSSMRLPSNRSDVRTNKNACIIHINFTGTEKDLVADLLPAKSYSSFRCVLSPPSLLSKRVSLVSCVVEIIHVRFENIPVMQSSFSFPGFPSKFRQKQRREAFTQH